MDERRPHAPRSRPAARRRADRQRALLRRVRCGDPAALEELTRSLAPLVRHIAQGYLRHGDDLEDLLQVGHVGVAKAIARFDATRGTPLSAYVAPTVAGEIRRYLRDATWRVHASRAVRETAWRLPHAEDRLRGALAREPDEREVAGELGVTVASLREARFARGANRQLPLAPEGHGTEQDLPPSPTAQDAVLRADELDGLRRAMARLRHAERLAIGMAFLEERSQRDIAQALGCSQMQVSRLIGCGLGKLEDELRVP